jgi:peptidyl-prolyl cis-trans isomerase SurA
MKQIFWAFFCLTLCGPAMPAFAQTASIAAVVNGQVITNDDVMARARLLAVSTGLPATPAALNRLQPQITKELIDQTLQLQEINRRNVVVAESDIAAAVAHIEQGNNLPADTLRQHLQAAGVPFSTLIAQLRTELGWQTVLHQVLGPELQPTPGDISAEKKALQAQLGTTQYHLAEIFIPVTDPADDAQAKAFANTVIAQLRTGAPFPIIAAQFSQADSALQGGDLGFVSASQLDPATAAVVLSMPAGAISNPIRVPGGYDIVQLQEMRKVGAATNMSLNIRQAYAAFAEPISNGSVGPDQAAVINKLIAAARGAHACADIEAINASFGNVRPADPGPVNLADVTPPQFQQVLANLAIGQVSQPLVAQGGVSVVMVCSRRNVADALPSDDDIRNLIVERRVALESQQLLDDLRHRSIITQN